MEELSFASDYEEGAHPRILERLQQTNYDKTPGYGFDEICDSAREKIRAACACPQAEVHFLIGGTQTNATVLSALLASYEGAIAAETGHIATHEAGAVELGGHKVLALPHENGKITADQVRKLCEDYEADGSREHIVMPGAVYLSQPTEFGTLYTLAELERMREVCERFGLILYVDGARLAYALATPENDVSLADLARLCDVFYIGGTKCGALLGEALVAPDPWLLTHFFTVMKQRGAVLAKGRVLGIQFDELFEDGLYERIGEPAIQTARALRALFAERGYDVVFDSPTNQSFVVLDAATYERLAQHVRFNVWERLDDGRVIVRFVTSWATRQEELDRLAALLDA